MATTQSPSLEGLEKFLRSKKASEEHRSWSPVKKENWIKLHQTPNIWGEEMSSKNISNIMKKTSKSVQDLADAMSEVILSADKIVDITSLDPPRNPEGEPNCFGQAILNGIVKRITSKPGDLVIRFLFGQAPGSTAARTVLHEQFQTELAMKLPMLLGQAKGKVTIVYGIYAGFDLGIPVFNHAKIVASDTGHAVVGGHNLYSPDYYEYPPVHDVSVEVKGPAAIDARNFAIRLWDYGVKSTSYLKSKYSTWTKAFEFVKNKWVRIENERFLEISKAAGYKKIGSKKGLGDTLYQNPASVKCPAKSPGIGWHKGRILTVGRTGGFSHLSSGSNNPSDYMKDYLMSEAKKSIKTAQQDMVGMSDAFMDKVEHGTCKRLANALMKNSKLEAFGVVTGIDGSGRMDAYCNVENGPQAVLNYIMYYTSKTKRADVQKRLHIAPVHFTHVPKNNIPYWPDSKGLFSNAPGACAVKEKQKAVGQHMKITLIDDSIMVVGSDNHYPHPLAEINYVIDGDFTKVFKKEFWDQIWKYSGPHAEETFQEVSMAGSVKKT